MSNIARSEYRDKKKYFMIPLEDISIGEPSKLVVAQTPLFFHIPRWDEAIMKVSEYDLALISAIDFVNSVLHLNSNKPLYDGNKNRIDSRREYILESFVGKRSYHKRLCKSANCSFGSRATWWEYLDTYIHNIKRTRFINEGVYYVNRNHVVKEGKIVAQTSEPLDKTSLEWRDDCRIVLKSFNRQGMPTEVTELPYDCEEKSYAKGRNMTFHYPRGDTCIGVLVSSADWVNLDFRYPYTCSLGADARPKILEDL